MGRIFFGGDFSSQSATLVAYNYDTESIVYTGKISMDEIADSIRVRTVNGMIQGPDEHEFSVPGAVIAAAVERAFRDAAADDSFLPAYQAFEAKHITA